MLASDYDVQRAWLLFSKAPSRAFIERKDGAATDYSIGGSP